MSGERIWIPQYEYKVLKTKPKRIDVIIPIDCSYNFGYNLFSFRNWVYFAQGSRYWKVRLKGKWAVLE